MTHTLKRYYYKIYNTSNAYITTWSNEVISTPTFRSVINGGPGELIVRLARSFDSFGEEVDIDLNNRVDLYVSDRQETDGTLLYRGFISGYRPVLDGNKEFLEITLLSYVFQLGYFMLRDSSGDTKIAYTSDDPSDILKDVIQKYRADGGDINYTSTSIQNTNTTVSYTFNTNTVREAIDKIIELAPIGWYWRLDADNIIHFKPREAISDHKFLIGSHINKMETWRRIEDVINRVYFTGFTNEAGTGLYRVYSNTGSITSYGLHALHKVDHRVSLASTADIMANRILDSKANPEIRTLMTLLDNNGQNEYRGYDIESVQPGETMEIRNIKQEIKTSSYWDQMEWDIDVWDQTIAATAADVTQILSVEYEPDRMRIETSSRLPEISKRVEDIYRNLVQTQTTNNPTSPTAG